MGVNGIKWWILCAEKARHLKSVVAFIYVIVLVEAFQIVLQCRN